MTNLLLLLWLVYKSLLLYYYRHTTVYIVMLSQAADELADAHVHAAHAANAVGRRLGKNARRGP